MSAAASAATSPAAKGYTPDPNLQPDVRLLIDGKLISPPARPILVGGSPYLPLRYLSEGYGATVTWNPSNRTAVVAKNGKVMDASGILVGGAMMVAPEFFAEMFSFSMVFYSDYNIVDISTTGKNGLLSEAAALYATPTYSGYSRDDLALLAKLVQAEVGNESFASRLAVANVVINRMNTAGFPSTIKGVIYDHSCGVQFTPTVNGAINNTPTGLSFLAAEEALEGTNNASTALFFFNPKYATSNWIAENRQFAFILGGHEYCY